MPEMRNRQEEGIVPAPKADGQAQRKRQTITALSFMSRSSITPGITRRDET
jgi:hypothetical protein